MSGKYGNYNVSFNDDGQASRTDKEKCPMSALRVAGWVGVCVATPFFLWAPLGYVGLIPSMIDVFGIVGLRIPAGVTIAGLLLAAVGFYED